MARVLGLLLAVAACLLLVGCAKRDLKSSTTATPGDIASSVAANGSPTATPVPERWNGQLSGAITGSVTGTLTPQCDVRGNTITVTLSGVVNGDPLFVNVRGGGAGSVNMRLPADDGPSVDVATAGHDVGEWAVVAGKATEDGSLTLEADGSGSLSATLPSITAGGQARVTVTADWSCAGG